MMNQNGFVLTEFLFAIFIAFGLTILTFALSYTLSTVEVTQYIVYSTSRAHAAANFDKLSQQAVARKKYEQLINDSAFKSLYTNGWFEVSKPATLEIKSGAGENFEQDYGSSVRKNLQGVRTTFKANLLEMQLPFLGDVTPDEDNDDGFVTKINALIIREVSHSECLDFMKARQDALWQMGGNRFSKFKASTQIDTPWEDNGC